MSISIDTDLLIDLYVNKKKSLSECGKILKVSRPTIYNRLNKLNISIRPIHISKTEEEKKARIKEYSTNYRKTDKYKQTRKSTNRAGQLKYYYGLSIEEYTILLDKQGSCCAICKTPQSKLKYRLSVDHNHTTGKVRELLCQKCNASLGLLNDDSELLRMAADYLDKHNNKESIG